MVKPFYSKTDLFKQARKKRLFVKLPNEYYIEVQKVALDALADAITGPAPGKIRQQFTGNILLETPGTIHVEFD